MLLESLKVPIAMEETVAMFNEQSRGEAVDNTSYCSPTHS